MADERAASSATGDAPGEPGTGGNQVLQGASLGAYAALLRRKPFRNLTLATLTSGMGDWIGFLAILALTEDILGPTRAALFAVSGVMVARVLPSLLLGPVAGVLVDRWDRKRVMIATDLGRGAVMALIPFTDEILTLVLATLVIELLSALFAPAKDAVFPSLVDKSELVLANQINLISTYGTLPIGALVNAALIALAVAVAPEGSFLAERPIALPIWFNALSFWVSAPLLARLEVPRSARRGVRADDPAEGPGPWEQLVDGFRFVATHPVIRALILGVMVAFAAAGVVISVGQFFARVLNAGPTGFGILVGLVGVGLVLGLVASANLAKRLGPERLFAPGIGVAGVSLVVTALMPSLPWAATPALTMGAGAGVSFIVGYTILQQRAGDDIRGRTFAAFNSGVRVALFGATVAAPALIGVLPPQPRELVELESGRQVIVYPWAIGNIRLSLIAGGLLALTGAVFTGRALHGAYASASAPGLALDGDAIPATRHGVLVVFEGGDGAGKSTQIRLLRSAVERAGWDARITREPGGTAIGEGVREVLLSPTTDAMAARTEALLYAAARAQHVDEVIRPLLEKGTVVLCDRFVDSSVVYQGAARGLGEERIAELNAWATGGLEPDLVVLLDVDPEEGLRRAASTAGPDRLESAGLAFHRQVGRAYRRRAAADPERYLVLDASLPVEQLHARVRAEVLDRLAERDADAVDAAPDGTAVLPVPADGSPDEDGRPS